MSNTAPGGLNLAGEFGFSCQGILQSLIPNEHPDKVWHQCQCHGLKTAQVSNQSITWFCDVILVVINWNPYLRNKAQLVGPSI